MRVSIIQFLEGLNRTKDGGRKNSPIFTSGLPA